jgi:hypothetical protein
MISGFWYDAKIAWYENDGNENFTTHIITTNAAGANMVYAIDVDDDGDLDVLSASFFDDKIAWYENQSCPISLDFDIKPQSCPNPLNIKSRGKFPVAVLGTNDFDVMDIDPSTLLLEGVAPVRWSIEDVSTPFSSISLAVDDARQTLSNICDCTTNGPDGYDDLTLKFSTQELVAALGPVNNGDELELTITGSLLDGTTIEGSDCVIIKGATSTNFYEYSLNANQCILLDNYTTILGIISSVPVTASFSGSTNTSIQGAFVMYVDEPSSAFHLFSYKPSGSTLTFTPGTLPNQGYKFAPFLVDWGSLSGNNGTIQVELTTGQNVTLNASNAILLDNLTQFPILGDFKPGKTYTAEISGNPVMPMQGVFVMYVDKGKTKFDYVAIGSSIDFKPGKGEYKFCAFQVDWSNIGDNSGQTHISIYEKNRLNKKSAEEKVEDFSLQNNYPNPFNPVTTISYSLPVKSEVELAIYNTLGESVVQLVNEEKGPGKYSVEFDAKDLPSGFYFYRLQAGSFVETKKMVLLR